MAKLVSKIKSFVAEMFLGFPPDSKISKSEAKKIQKQEYDTVKAKPVAKKYTPPYKELVLHLEDSCEQVVQAAIYNLAGIAVNSKNYRADILQALEKRLVKTPNDKYLSKKISEIKNTRS